MQNILVVSRNGIGSCIILKYKIEKILNDLRLFNYQVYHCSLNDMGKHDVDLIVTPANLSNDIKPINRVPIIALQNVMDDRELKLELENWFKEVNILR
ncbi:PTS sugar transporter subunit IIB [Neobacillus niacini]|uniref:PTS sugar transporter subunit IIB n=1 Tax=Neobacillus niacini TaxID=86668 RepID=UPI0021CB16F5|nr:hypothetical protein [Neobacillus niacini]MCM3763636.1 hypothetical protein [Neobacillus niacini]